MLLTGRIFLRKKTDDVELLSMEQLVNLQPDGVASTSWGSTTGSC